MFSNTDFTYPMDALNAFAGILLAFGSTFQAGFMSAMPQLWFNKAIL